MRALVLVAACAAIVGISYGMHSPIVPVFAREELGADFSQVGLVGVANYLPYMFAPFFVGMMLDRNNKAYLLASGIGLNVFSIYMLSAAQTVPEAMAFRGLAGVAHALFWPSCEVLISTNAGPGKRVKWISLFTAAWVGGFMAGPLAGRLVLELLDYGALFQISAAVVATALVPAMLLARHGRPVGGQEKEGGSDEHARAGGAKKKPSSLSSFFSSLAGIKRELASMPAVSAVIIYYAVTFGVILAVYPAYMKSSSLADTDIELLFFLFGAARFATLPFVQKLAAYGRAALASAVTLTAAGMLISFLSTSVASFAAALVFIGISTSIFYPVTFNFVTKNVPLGKIGSRLGIYETMFGMGWTAGPIAAGLSSDAFGPPSPYLAFAVIGGALAGAILLLKRQQGDDGRRGEEKEKGVTAGP